MIDDNILLRNYCYNYVRARVILDLCDKFKSVLVNFEQFLLNNLYPQRCLFKALTLVFNALLNAV